MKSRRGRILGIIIIMIFLPILIINTLLIVKSYLNPNEAPNVFGFKPFIVLSGSMEPTIKTGDIVIIKNCDKDKLKTGDIIAYKSGKSIITHRIDSVIEEDGEKKFITKGDNNNAEDKNPVSISSVEGIFIRRIPKIRKFCYVFTNNNGCSYIYFNSIYFVYDYRYNSKK
ncbi:MAG: signal peptidase I [Clostridia bacterium]|nr:signal peptidase I [Clostridia bacterium]